MINSIESWGPGPRGCRHAIVFVHGIFSSHSTFENMYVRLRGNPNFAPTEMYYFDYEWGDSLETNGVRLSKELVSVFGQRGLNVSLVCHSMGGLVARLALLHTQHLMVRRAFFLGTPNFGAVSTAQLNVYAQLLMKTASVVVGTFIRKPGVLNLTRAYEIMSNHLDKASYVDHVDYVSIPGCYFHPQLPGYAISTQNRSANAFQTLSVLNSILQVAHPKWGVKMSRPHDGIVEERSNSFVPVGAGKWSEKSAAVCNLKGKRRYAHVQPKVCEGLTHSDIQNSPEIIELVAEICGYASLDDWLNGLTGTKDMVVVS